MRENCPFNKLILKFCVLGCHLILVVAIFWICTLPIKTIFIEEILVVKKYIIMKLTWFEFILFNLNHASLNTYQEICL